MKIGQIFQWLPLHILLGILCFVVISSFDGVVYAEIISRIVNFSTKSSFQDIFNFAIWAIVIRCVVFFFSYLAWAIKARAVKILNTKLKSNFFKGYLGGNEQITSSTAVSTLTNDYNIIERHYFTLIFEVFTYILTLATSIIYMISIDVLLGISFVVLSFGAFLPSLILDKLLQKRAEKNSEEQGRFVSAAKDTVLAKEEVILYQSIPQILTFINKRINKMEDYRYKYITLSTAISVLSTTLSFLGRFTPVIFALYLIVKNGLSPQRVIAVFVASDRIDFPLRMISQYVSMIRSTKPLREKIVIYKDEMKSLTAESKPDSLDIILENVSFSYDKDLTFFKNVSLKIPHQQKVLLVGPSGEGKSTLLKLIQGHLRPTDGQIRFIDQQGKDVSGPQNTGAIAIISQQPVVFRGSIRFNLGFNKEEISDVDMVFALELVNLKNELGSEVLEFQIEENGANLSGGQLQRLEIARAIVHKPKIILADEMTAALDQKNAEAIRANIWNLPITVIEVAHHYTQKDVSEYNLRVLDIMSLKNK